MRRSCLVLAAIALTASACSQPAQDDKAGDAGTAENALSALGTPRPGLWEQTISGGTAAQPVTFRVCVGEANPDHNPFTPPSQDGGDCQKTSFTRTPTGMTFETVCSSDGVTMASKGEVTGDLRSRYEATINMRLTGAELPPGSPAETNLRIAARRVGDCPAGVEPDTILP